MTMKMLDRVAAAIDAERKRWALEEMDGRWFAIRRTSPEEGSKWDLGDDREDAQLRFEPAVNDALAAAAIGAMKEPSPRMLSALTDLPAQLGWSAAIDLAMSGADGEEARN